MAAQPPAGRAARRRDGVDARAQAHLGGAAGPARRAPSPQRRPRMIAPPQTLEIRITREFDAPPEEVFRAWTVPSEVAAWYGPVQYDSPEEKIHIDLRVGG